MADHTEVLTKIIKHPGVSYPVLTPNLLGLKSAVSLVKFLFFILNDFNVDQCFQLLNQMEAGAKEVAVFGAASESFSRKNINCSIEESIKRFKEVVIEAKKNGIRIRGYVSCVCGCPYEGPIAPSAVAKASRSFYTLKCFFFLI